MIDVEDMDSVAVLVDPVDDAVSAAACTLASGEWPEQRLADPVRVYRQRGVAELQHSGGNRFRERLGDRRSRGRLEPDFVPLRSFGRHEPVMRRRARSRRTVLMSAPGSPRPSAARLSEMRRWPH